MKTDKGNNKTKNNHSDELINIDSSPTLEPSWDYEFQKSTQTFEDALFTDDDALDQALEQVAKKKHDNTISITQELETPTQTVIQTQSAIKPDLTPFLTEGTQAGSFLLSNNCKLSSDTHLSIINATLNDLSSTLTVDDAEKVDDAVSTLQGKVDQSIADKSNQSKTNAANSVIELTKQHCLTSKAQLEEYFGRTLPQRELPLEFQFSTLKPKKYFESIVSSPSIRRLFSFKGTSQASIFKQADLDLANIVKCKLSKSYQLDVLNTYSPPLSEKIRSLIITLERKPCTPGDSKRLEMTLHAQNAIKHLISGYKQIYQAMYTSPNYVYGPNRNKNNQCAFRLLDLLCLEQNLAIALQRALPTGSAKVFNTLYNALYLYEPQLLSEQHHSLAFGVDITIQQMFLYYQLLQCVDMMLLSVTQHKFVYQYIQQNISLLILRSSLDFSETIEPWLIITYNCTDAPKLVVTLPNHRVPATLIGVLKFFNQIKKDYNESLTLIGTENPSHSSPVLAALPNNEILPVLSVLNLCVYRIENNIKRVSYSIYKPTEKKVYVELNNAIAYLKYQYTAQSALPSKEEPDKNAASKPKSAKNEWLCAMEDDNTLYLQSSEIKSDLALDVGIVVLFIQTVDDVEQLQLALITRMERIQHGKLNLVAKKIGDKATYVSLKTASEKYIPAIVSVHNNKQYLITTHDEQFWSGKAIKTVLADESEAIMAIEALESIWQKVQVLSLM